MCLIAKFARVIPIAGCVAALGALACANAAAQTSFHSDAASTLTLISTGGLGITMETTFDGTGEVEIGSGMASSSGHQLLLGGGTVVDLLSSVAGSATPPGPAFSSTFYMSGSRIHLDNPSDSVATALFEFAYSWDISALVTDPLLEISSTGAFFHVTGIETETLTIDGVPMAEYLVHMRSDTGLGLGPSIGSDSVIVGITVGPRSVHAFSVITDAAGMNGIRAVPEPSTIAFTLCGIGTTLWVFRRKRT